MDRTGAADSEKCERLQNWAYASLIVWSQSGYERDIIHANLHEVSVIVSTLNKAFVEVRLVDEASYSYRYKMMNVSYHRQKSSVDSSVW